MRCIDPGMVSMTSPINTYFQTRANIILLSSLTRPTSENPATALYPSLKFLFA